MYSTEIEITKYIPYYVPTYLNLKSINHFQQSIKISVAIYFDIC